MFAKKILLDVLIHSLLALLKKNTCASFHLQAYFLENIEFKQKCAYQISHILCKYFYT